MNNSYNPTVLQKYLSGLLDPSDMHQIEKDALNDPFLQDAIDGLSSQDLAGQPQLSILQRRLAERLADQGQEKSTSYFNFQRLAVASTAGVLLIVLGILFWMQRQPQVPPANNDKHVQIELTKIPTLTPLKGDAVPSQGWERYEEYLALPEMAERQGSIRLQIKIQNGRPQSVELLGPNNNEFSEKIVDKILGSSGWQGETVLVELQY